MHKQLNGYGLHIRPRAPPVNHQPTLHITRHFISIKLPYLIEGRGSSTSTVTSLQDRRQRNLNSITDRGTDHFPVHNVQIKRGPHSTQGVSRIKMNGGIPPLPPPPHKPSCHAQGQLHVYLYPVLKECRVEECRKINASVSWANEVTAWLINIIMTGRVRLHLRSV